MSVRAPEQFRGSFSFGVASVFSVMRNASVPRGISTPSAPNFASPIWRTLSDQKNRGYYFENTASPSLVCVKLQTIDFKEGSGVRKLTLVGNPDVGVDQTGAFVRAEPFKFLMPNSAGAGQHQAG